jgi:pyruvate/2-oxoglutarate/acetoin dehydrogenase E1 component/TPP-dependent pyruvate/acetoin dehydrogenase alpha subunit
MIEAPQLEDFLREEKTEDDSFANEVLKDFYISCLSREVSLLGRKEVLTGKAKFGILGDGKEVPQVAMARAFKKGDHRAGYYRDQTFMFALGLMTVEDFFAQLYADPENDPFSGGRQMNAHFSTPYINEKGEWLDHRERFNISADVSPTAGQMARSLGLAYASSKYKTNEALKDSLFSDEGKEVCFCTIGDASTSEGVFFETVNAAAVIKAPLAISIWDDGYGISVPRSLQTAKDNISKALQGFAADDEEEGVLMFSCKAWDYPALIEMYEKGIEKIRLSHLPGIFHITEVTQPQGHSTSGSHERYKSEERLNWEEEHDCIVKMADWIVDSGIAERDKVEEIREQGIQDARDGKKRAWETFRSQVDSVKSHFERKLEEFAQQLPKEETSQIKSKLKGLIHPNWSEIVEVARDLRFALINHLGESDKDLDAFINEQFLKAEDYYHTHLYSEGDQSALKVPVVPAKFDQDAKKIPGYEILNKFFDHALETYPELYAFGEDVGKIGDVNQGFAGLQEKHGVERVFDTGIREWTIVGQAIGMAMRGLRPVAEIQYLDYLMYALSALTDDLATLRYRSDGTQKAPAIIRTRGHRLEGIWHAGSHLGMIIHALRGIHVLVPRNMTQAAGMYNTLLQSDDPALVIECLNGYRLREAEPNNIGSYTVPLGQPEVLRNGTDITLVTYGSCVRIAEKACDTLSDLGISVELIDAQTLLPFDLEGIIKSSLEQTNRIVFLDEDVPGGATAYMMNEVLDEQEGYFYLDSKPVCITAKAHRPPYGSDGDYFTKPNAEDVVERIYELMNEVNPDYYPYRFRS